jgi:sugar-specific transcriptional regulator TrmB
MKMHFKNRKFTGGLAKVGLSSRATIVYTALLELGSAFPSRIAEYVKMNRSTVYHLLTELTSYGLVSEFQHNRKLCYQIEKPAQLVAFAESQVIDAQKRLESAERLFPEIEGMLSRLPQRPKIRYFEGVEGVTEVYKDHIQQRNYVMLAFGNAAEIQNFFSKRFLHGYVKRKAQLRITTRVIMPDSDRDVSYNQAVYRHVSPLYWPIIKHVSKEIFPFQSEITMYGRDRVSLINFQEKSMVGIIIEDTTINNMMRMVFELAWASIGLVQEISGTKPAQGGVEKKP